MTPGKLALTMYQGATFKRIIRLTDSTPTAIDLTGATVRMHVRATISDTATLIELTDRMKLNIPPNHCASPDLDQRGSDPTWNGFNDQ